MYRCLKAVAVLVLISPQAALFAQTPRNEPRTPIAAIPAVRELMARAKDNNPDFAAAKSRVHAEHALIGPAGALPDPDVSFALERGPDRHVMIMGGTTHETSHLTGTLPGMTEFSMSLGQGIPWPGKLAAREGVARQGAKRSEVGTHETTLALEAGVLASALELLVIQARRELLASQLNYWAAMEQIIKTNLDQGVSSASEAIQVMQEQGRIKLRLLELDNQAQDQKDILNQLAARDYDFPIDLGADILKLELPKPPEEAELLDDLRARNPEWLASLADIKGAEASIHSAKMERFPDFFTGVSLSKGGSMPVAWMVEVGLSMPIWSGRKQNRVVARAQAERGVAESAQAGLALALTTKARERARAWKLADATARLYESELIPQGEAALEILRARFQNGGASFGSMLEGLNALLKDQENRLDAIAQIHRAAILQHRASLDGAAGGLNGGSNNSMNSGMNRGFGRGQGGSAPAGGQSGAKGGGQSGGMKGMGGMAP